MSDPAAPLPAPPAAPADPPPAKRRGCWRAGAWGCGGLLGLLALAAAGIWWHGSTDIAPIDDSDLRITLEPLPREENALHWLRVAADALRRIEVAAGEDDDVRWIGAWGHWVAGQSMDETPPWDDDRVAAALARTAAADVAIGRAASCARAQLTAIVPVQVSADDFSGMDLMAAAPRLCAISELDRRQGRHSEAVAALERTVCLGRLSRAGPGYLMHYMAGHAAIRLAMGAAKRLAADGGCPAHALDRLADCLASGNSRTEDLVRLVRVEYETTVGTIERFEQEGSGPGGQPLRAGFHYHPNRTRALVADHSRRARDLVGTVRPGRRYAVIHSRSGWLASLGATFAGNGAGRLLFETAFLGWEDVFALEAELDLQLDLTRCLLLATAHRRRTGSLPPNLDALVGPHLADVPLDPYDNRPLRYDPARGLIWSVGPDGVDDGGSDPDQRDPVGDPVEFWRLPDPTVRVPP